MPSPTQRWGLLLERETELYLVRLGYRIVGRNFRGGGGELDIIAWDGPVLCFVEVRGRRTAAHGEPALTVTRAKRRKLIRAAQAYLVRWPRWPMVRFDVVGVVAPSQGPRRFRLFRNAFDADGCD